MTFHTTPQVHATISHNALFFTTPSCTPSHSVVHHARPHGHSTSYHSTSHLMTQIYIYRSICPQDPSFLLWTPILCLCAWNCVPLVSRVCARCSDHIPHRKCCSVYVISRVQIAFHSTPLHTTWNVFTPHIIPSHHAKRFYITPPFTSHHST